jgi:hypothetical protein
MPGLIARQLQRACHGNLAAKLSAVRVQSLRPGPPAFKHRSEGIQLFVQRSHLGAFLFRGDIPSKRTFESRSIPPPGFSQKQINLSCPNLLLMSLSGG